MKRLLLATVPFAFAAIAVAHAAPPQSSAVTPAPAPSAAASSLPGLPTAKPNAGNATPAPPKDPDAHTNLTGVWEVAMQTTDGVVYTHFNLKQDGNLLTGQYLDESNKKFPLTGTFDGKTVRVVVALPNGTAMIFSGTEEQFTDMVGTLTGMKNVVGFTAAYRPKFKWIDNISPGSSMGGLGGSNPIP